MKANGFGLLLQRLSVHDRVLAAASVVGTRNGHGWFTPQDVQGLFDALRVPRPGNVHRSLASLGRAALLRKATRGTEWGITPLGQESAQELVGTVNLAELEAELRGTPGSEFGHALHTVISPSFAPAKWLVPIARLLEQFPFERNVFLITRFPADEGDQQYLDPIKGAIPVIRDVLSAHGLALHLASDRQLDDDLLGNVAAHMWACQYGIGILENRVGRGLNYNAITEIGAMLMTGRRCAILKDRTAPQLPTDIAGQIYKPVVLSNLNSLGSTIHDWAAKDLSLGECERCPEEQGKAA